MTKSTICIVLLSVFTSFFVEAQQDTIIDNKPFTVPVVQARETLYSISRQYNAELNDLVIANPAVIQGLHVGFKLLVPLHYNTVKPIDNNIISQSTKPVISDTLSKKNKNDSDFQISNISNYEHDAIKIKVALLAQFKNAIDELFAIDESCSLVMKQTNPYLLGELKRYYPNTWALIEQLKQKVLFNIMKNNLNKGVEQGIYRKEIDVDIIAKLMISRIDALVNDEIFPLTHYDFRKLLTEIRIYHLRGIATFKGINYLEQKINEE